MIMQFGTSGLRGIYGKEITPQLFYEIANRFRANEIGLGRDIRPSSVILYHAALSGLLSNGSVVFDAGIVPTPTLVHYKPNSIMITASHNPIEFNGIKLFKQHIELNKNKASSYLNGGLVYEIGEYVNIHEEAVEKHIEDILRNINIDVEKRVVIDCNGPAYVILPKLFHQLGAHFKGINCSEIMNRKPEPNKINLSHLENYDLAFGFDGDSDRISMIYNKQFISGDRLFGLISLYMLRKGIKDIVTTVETSLGIKQLINSNGGRLHITPVGSTYVGDKMFENGFKFGGEPAGEFIYSSMSFVPDAIYSLMILLDIVHNHEDLLNLNIPEFYMIRQNYKTKEKDIVLTNILDKLSLDGKYTNMEDGVRIDSEDYWLLIRKSGTEPLIRLTVEAKTKDIKNQIFNKCDSLIKSELK